MCPLPRSSCCARLTVMHWPPLKGTLVPHGRKSQQSECEKAILSTLPIDWQWATHPRLIFLRSQFKSELPPCRGGIMNNKELCIFVAWFISQCIYAGVSTWNALVVGNGSYIVRPCGHDLHGPTHSAWNRESRYLFVHWRLHVTARLKSW